MKRAKKYTAYLILSVLGLVVGQHLHRVFPSRTPEIALRVGEDLVAGKMSPDGRYLAGVGRKEGSWFVQVWDNEGREIMSRKSLMKPAGRFHGFDWSPGGENLAISAGDQVWVFRVKDGSKSALAASAQVRTVEYDGPFLMARARSATFVWKGQESQPFWRLDQGYLLHSTVNAESGRLATACFEDGVRVFDLRRKRQVLHVQPGLTSAGLQFDSKGLLLSSGFRNRGNRKADHIITFDSKSGRAAGPTLDTPQLLGYQFSANGETVASRQHSGASVWSVENGKRRSHREGPSAVIDVLSDDGRWVATVPGGGLVSIWATWPPETEYQLQNDHPVSDVSFAGPGWLLAVGGHATLWKIPE